MIQIGRRGLVSLVLRDVRSRFSAVRFCTKESIRSAIWECSDKLTAVGGVQRAWDEGLEGKRCRFSTEVQIGIVFERASGMDLPRRVVSTRIHLFRISLAFFCALFL